MPQYPFQTPIRIDNSHHIPLVVGADLEPIAWLQNCADESLVEIVRRVNGFVEPSPTETIPVDADALGQILRALLGPEHLIRELQFTLNTPLLKGMAQNPINRLVDQYNAGCQE